MDKLSDEQIIKALECRMPFDKVCVLAYDLINRQKAENERLQLEIESCNSENAELKTEIERLEKENNSMREDITQSVKELKNLGVLYAKDISKTKSEAIKEFAERLKTVLYMPDNRVIGRTIYTDEIDNLVKRMVGE